jgi:hypothetical protein
LDLFLGFGTEIIGFCLIILVLEYLLDIFCRESDVWLGSLRFVINSSRPRALEICMKISINVWVLASGIDYL